MPGMSLQPGDVFAGYIIERELGSGGMGAVYLARHPRLPRMDALKLLRPELCTDPSFVARFEREADMVARLDHPNIVSVHDRGSQDGQLWISMRFIDGTNAEQALRDEPGGMPPERVVRIIGKVASALDYAHRHGLLHRDVKPANILLTPGPEDEDELERIFLSDFGVAKAIGEASESMSSLTNTGSVVATLDYASPEQIKGQALDHRSDIYALGCVLYKLLTGDVPYPAESIVARVYGHLNKDVPRPSEAVPGLPTGFDDVVATAMAKDRDDRYQTCRALAFAARAALTTGSAAARPADDDSLPTTVYPVAGLAGRTHPGSPSAQGEPGAMSAATQAAAVSPDDPAGGLATVASALGRPAGASPAPQPEFPADRPSAPVEVPPGPVTPRRTLEQPAFPDGSWDGGHQGPPGDQQQQAEPPQHRPPDSGQQNPGQQFAAHTDGGAPPYGEGHHGVPPGRQPPGWQPPGQQPPGGQPPGGQSPGGPGPEARRRWPVIAAIVAAVLVLAGGGTWFVLRNSSNGQASPGPLTSAASSAAASPSPASSSAGPSSAVSSSAVSSSAAASSSAALPPATPVPGLPHATPLPEQVLVVGRVADDVAALYQLDAASGESGKQLTEGVPGALSPLLSADRGTLIYVRTGTDAADTLRTVAVDGSGDRQLFDLPPGCDKVARPAWNPVDQTELALPCTTAQGDVRLHRIKVDGTDEGPITTGFTVVDDVTYSPDGSTLAFWASEKVGGAGTIYLQPADGSAPARRLTQTPEGASDVDPGFSPDGGTVAFTRSQAAGDGVPASTRIYLAGVDGSDVRPLTPASEFADVNPCYSPDGTVMAFKSNRPGAGGSTGNQIWTIRLDGTQMKQLAGGAPGSVTASPAWIRR
jgi:serine/threonine protein kinase